MNTKTDEPVKNPVPGPQSTKSVAPSATTVKDPDESPKNPPSDNTVTEPEQPDPDAPELSLAEEKALEKILDGDDESTDPDRPAVVKGHVPSAVTKLRRLVALVPAETPNEHSVWGAAGVSLTLGDLRELVKVLA